VLRISYIFIWNCNELEVLEHIDPKNPVISDPDELVMMLGIE
jgi:hypothetical protein